MATTGGQMATMAGSQAQGGSPEALTCRSAGCQRLVTSTGHRFCCSGCKCNPAGPHTRRCDRQHRGLCGYLRDVHSECITPGCTLQVGIGHLTCCSSCGATGGARHTAGCGNRSSRIMYQAMHGAMGQAGVAQPSVPGQYFGPSSAGGPAPGPVFSGGLGAASSAASYAPATGHSYPAGTVTVNAREFNTAVQAGTQPSMVIDLTALD